MIQNTNPNYQIPIRDHRQDYHPLKPQAYQIRKDSARTATDAALQYQESA